MLKQFHICLYMVSDPTWSGGVLYIQNLVRAIASLPSAETAHIKLSLVVRKSNLALAEPIKHQVTQIQARNLLGRGYSELAKFLAEHVKIVPLEMLNPHAYDFVYPTVAGKRSPYKWAGWIPDFQHYHLPHLFSSQEIAKRNASFQKMAEASPMVILSSEMARADFCHLYPKASDRITVMHFASYPDPAWFVPDPQVIQSKYALPDRFFLVSNQFWKHKDHAVIVEALGILQQRNVYPTVVCTGSLNDYRHPEYFSQLMAMVEQLGLGKQFIVLGLIPRIEQIQLMRTCLAVIQPSLFEGWSSVIEDARSLGKTVIASDFPVHIEQNYSASHFFECGNAEALAEQIDQGSLILHPGADEKSEALASEASHARVMAYGRSFLAIADGVVNR
jgi:glycosyltransferase involved in cell wall biosynthesis